VYVAPNTGGESFGVVLVEAMAAQTAVLASDLPAFKKVLEEGVAGALFRNEDPDDLSRQLTSLLEDEHRRRTLTATGNAVVRRYDWAAVAGQIVRVYETVVGGGA
jgi:phosphatidylinositol alpha-mannosyltransferase